MNTKEDTEELEINLTRLEFCPEPFWTDPVQIGFCLYGTVYTGSKPSRVSTSRSSANTRSCLSKLFKNASEEAKLERRRRTILLLDG